MTRLVLFFYSRESSMRHNSRPLGSDKKTLRSKPTRAAKSDGVGKIAARAKGVQGERPPCKKTLRSKPTRERLFSSRKTDRANLTAPTTPDILHNTCYSFNENASRRRSKKKRLNYNKCYVKIAGWRRGRFGT